MCFYRVNRTSDAIYKRNFTIVELLLVVSIIAILTSLLLPALKSARERVKDIACANNLKQIYFAEVSYANDNDGYLTAPYGNGWATAYWMGLLCNTGHAYSNKTITSIMDADFKNSIFDCPFTNWVQGTSKINIDNYGMNPGAPLSAPPYDYYKAAQFSRVKNPSKLRLAGDGGQDGWTLYGLYSPTANNPRIHHTTFFNLLFFDGHVSLITPKIYNNDTDYCGY